MGEGQSMIKKNGWGTKVFQDNKIKNNSKEML